MKKEVLPLISSSSTLSRGQTLSCSRPQSLPPILLTGVDKAQSSITGAALGLSPSFSNSQSHSRHSHKSPEEEDKEDVISGIRSDFTLSLSLSRAHSLVRLSLSFSNCFSFCLASLIRVSIYQLFIFVFVFQGLLFRFWVNSGLQL